MKVVKNLIFKMHFMCVAIIAGIIITPFMIRAQTENWVYRYNGPGNSFDRAYAITYGADSNIYAAGHSTGSSTSTDFTVISLGFNISVKENNSHAVRKALDATILAGPLQLPESNSFRVFDITGRMVEPNRIKSGIYFIEIDGKISQKVIKVK